MSTIDRRISIIGRRKLIDSRGYFLKVLTGHEEGLPKYTGEIYLTSAYPGEAKGGHYHPKANEWFTLIQGECDLKLEDIMSKESKVIKLSESEPVTVFIPSNIAHQFVNTNLNAEFLLLAYTDQLYDPADTIAYQL